MEFAENIVPAFSNEEIQLIREDFPILKESVNGKKLVYFDNGATSQKPQQVINAISEYYSRKNANIHRGVHTLSREITIAFEEVRKKTAAFINASNSNEIIFTKGTTDSINIVAHGLSKIHFKKGDEIIVSEMEHHSNILPWQAIREQMGIVLKIAPVSEAGELMLEKLEELLSEKTKLVAITHVSNTLGTINPIKQVIQNCKKRNIPVLVDGAQAVPHMKVDMIELDCDFYCFSAHKMCGPTGIGILFAKQKWIDAMPPYQQGGGIIKRVSFEKTEYIDGPLKFEAGTPNISGVIGFGSAIDYLSAKDMDRISVQENFLLKKLNESLIDIEGIKIFGTSDKKAAVVSFEVKGIHHFDLGTLLDQQGIAVRTGHHCTQPLWQKFGVEGAVRASLSFYNTLEEIEQFSIALKKSIRLLS